MQTYKSRVSLNNADLQEAEQKKQDFLKLSKEEQKAKIDKLVNELFPRVA